MPDLSIITVTRNNAQGLRKTLQSVREQVIQEFELLIVDGNSTDETPEVIASFSDLAPQVMSDSGKGVYAAMNEGVQCVSRKWISFLNAGDCFYDSNVLASFNDAIDADLAYGRAWNETTGKAYRVKPLSEIWKGNIFCHQALFSRRETHLRHPFDENLKIVADYKYYTDCLKSGYRFQELDLDVATIEPGGISGQQIYRRTWERFQVARKAFPDKPVTREYLAILRKQIQQQRRKRRKAAKCQ